MAEDKDPAPGELALPEAFVNTAAFLYHREELHHPALLRDWLVQHRLLGADEPVGDADLTYALEVREALRNLLRANTGLPRSAEAVETLNRAMHRASLVPHIGDDGQARLVPQADGVYAAIGHVLANVVLAMADGSWSLLKACRNDDCQYAFYDRSKNHSGTWCVMAIRGNRHKTRGYRQRRGHRALPSESGFVHNRAGSAGAPRQGRDNAQTVPSEPGA